MTPTLGACARMRRSYASFRIAVFLSLLAVLAGCASTKWSAPPGEGDRVAHARHLVDSGDNRDAVEVLLAFLQEHPGSRYLDEAIFLLGRAHYELGSYYDAEEQFRKVCKDFPESAFYCESLYQLALAILSQARPPELDQAERHAALVEFNSFLGQCPDSPIVGRAREHILDARTVLAEKEMKNGLTYVRLGSHKAARHHYRKVVEDFPETKWVPAAMLSLCKSYESKDEWAEAVSWAQRLIAEHPESYEAEDAAGLLERANGRVPVPGAEEKEAATPDQEKPKIRANGGG